MLTVNTSVILEDATRLIDWDPDQLEDRQVAMRRMAFSLACAEVWESWWWEQLMVVEQVQFTGDYQQGWMDHGDGYETGHVVYSPITDAYYIALWGIAGPPVLTAGESLATYGYEPPGTGTASPGYTTICTGPTDNKYGWARYNGRACGRAGWLRHGQAPATWVITMTPALGDLCYWDGNIFAWVLDQGAADNYQPDPSSAWSNTQTFPAPGWIRIAPWQPTFPSISQDATLVASGKSLRWQYVANPIGPSGPVHTVSLLDPRITPNCGPLRTRTSDDGNATVVLGLDIGRPWIAARRPTPVISANPYDPTAAYAADDPNNLVFDS